MDWIEAVIKHELAAKYNGYFGYSLSPEKVLPEAGKYPTYISWMQSEWDRIESYVKKSDRSSSGEKELSIKRRLTMLPSVLQPLVG